MIEKLRAQPEHIKERVILGLTIGIFSIILLVWISSLGARTKGEKTRENTLSPLAGMGEVFRGVVSDAKAIFPSSILSTSTEQTDATSTPKAPPRLEATVIEFAPDAPMPETKVLESDFDISGIVIIDSKTATTSVKGKK